MAINNRSLRNKKILITCGPTWVRVDPVRVISNRSSGELGHWLAQELQKTGANVTLLEGPVTHAWKNKGIKVRKFLFFEELWMLLNRELHHKYDVLIHAAAVSDFKLKKHFSAKITSDKDLRLELTATPKLINRLKKLNKDIFLVGFKLESALPKESIAKKTRPLFTQARCDLAVANVSHPSRYHGYIVQPPGKIIKEAADRKALAKMLVQTLKEKL